MYVHVLCMTLFRILILTVGHDSITYCVCAGVCVHVCVCACAVYDTVSRSDTVGHDSITCVCVCV